MKSVKKILLSIIISVFYFSINIYAHHDLSDNEYDILFIGASYFTYNNLTGIMKNILNDCGIQAKMELHTAGGPYLYDHAYSSLTKAKIREKDWDFIVLQGVGSLTAYPDVFTDNPVYPALKKLHEFISGNCKSAKMIFCLPWAFEDGMTWKGWPDTYEDMQIKIYNNTILWAEEIGFSIAPVGWAWKSVLKEKGYPLHYLHQSDWNHPSLKGSYLMACVIYCTLFLEKIETTYYADLEQEEAVYFQSIASSTVMNHLAIWTEIPNQKSLPGKFQLYQNYPNPFNSYTSISYYLPEMNTVSINIYDSLGRELKSFKRKSQNAGHHIFTFYAHELAAGLYMYQLKIGNKVYQYKKMVLLK